MLGFSAAPAWALECISVTMLHSSFFLFSLTLLCIALLIDFRRRRQRERELQELRTTKQHLNAALWGSGDGLWDWDLHSGRITRSGIAEMLGFSPNQLPGTATALFESIHPQDQETVLRAIGRHLRQKTPFFEVEYRVQHANGQWRWVLQRGRLLDPELGGAMHLGGTLKDITARKSIERELQFSWTVLEHMNECVIVTDAEFRVLRVNAAFSKLFGYRHQEILSKDTSLLDGDDCQPTLAIRHQAREKGQWSGELMQRLKNGELRLMQLDLKRISEPVSGEFNFVAVMTDITGRRKQEEELRYLAENDYLTGLSNRQAFHRQFAERLQPQGEQRKPLALYFLDLDHFKKINDSLGHGCGDLLLQLVASRLRHLQGEQEVLARLGGDEFVLLSAGTNVAGLLQAKAQQILAAFLAPFVIEGHEIIITPSIGVSCYPEHGLDGGVLLQKADLALYQAKQEGRGRVQIYHDELQTQAPHRLKLENALRKAISQAELEVWFQPRWDIRENAVTGFEALVRWHSSAFGPVKPDEFIAIAEELDLISDIGDWMLNAACRHAATWWRQNHCWRVSVNLSAKQLKQTDLVQRVQQALSDHGLPACALELELTESQLLTASASVADNLSQLRALGVRMALDDFGTGYSAFSYLRRYRFDTLKIPKEFVAHTDTDVASEAIISAMIALAHKLDMTVVAEGVETSEQHKRLRQMQCDEIQGYFIGEPLAGAELLRDIEEFIG